MNTPERIALLEALLQATSTLANGQDPQALLQDFCDGLVKASSHIRMAWVYIGDRNAEIIRPHYVAGPAHMHVDKLAIGNDPLSMRGPARQTLATGKPVIMRVDTDEGFSLWRDSALEAGLRSVASIAFHDSHSEESGLLAVGADIVDFFDEQAMQAIIAFARLGDVALTQAATRKQLETLATYDHLTGAYNRRAFEALLAQEHARALRHGRTYSLFLLDVDYFKLVNDSYGHGFGDQVLIEVAQLSREVLRQSDYLGRWGGEEFICLLPETANADAYRIAERLRDRIFKHIFTFLNQKIQVSVSIGVATYPTSEQDPRALLNMVDSQLYNAKHDGRNRVVNQPAPDHLLSLAGQIESALLDNRIRPAYQAIVDLKTGQVVAEESLARLLTPAGNMLKAVEFIEIAKRFNLIHRIDYEVMRQSMTHCSLQSLNNEHLLHFVNLSESLLRHPLLVEGLLQHAQRQCRARGQSDRKPKSLVIEITEREFLGNTRKALDGLSPLIDYGLRLALDDFGNGYSSFKYLQDLPIHFLKLEGNLVRHLKSDRKAHVLIRRSQQIAQDLGMVCIAEFIEDQETADILRELGVDWGQGYFFGEALLDNPN